MSFLSSGVISVLIFALPACAGSSLNGVRNFHQVDALVYRGGQPTTAGFQYLAKIGVKTVVDLRAPGRRSAAERSAVTALGMQYVNVPMIGLTPPTEAQTTKILGLLEDTTTGPVFVHCKRGSDRTGAVIGAYRINCDHWDNARALREAMSLGMGFFQLPRQHYIRNFRPGTIMATTDPKSGRGKAPARAVAAAAVPVPAAH